MLLILLVAALSAVPVATAGACSCAVVDPRAALSRAEAAFVGTVVSRRQVPGADLRKSVEVVLTVERAYKGDLGETVTLRTSDNDGTCGLPLNEGERTGLLLRRDEDGWTAGLCDMLAPADLEEATRPYPRGKGEGRVRLLITGPFHDAGLVALASRGEVIGWVFGSEGDTISACPGTRYAVQAGDDLSLIRMSDLRVVERLALPGDWTRAVRCLHRRGRDVVAATSPFGMGSESATLVRSKTGRIARLASLKTDDVALGRSNAYFLARRERGSQLVAVAYRDGRRRPIGGSLRSDTLAVSPDGRRVAVVEGPPRRRLHLIATGTGRDRSRRVDVEWSAPVWLNSRRVAVPSGRQAVVFDLRLRRTGTLPAGNLHSMDVAAGRLWGLTREGGVRAIETDTGRRFAVRAPRLDGARGLAALDRRADVMNAGMRAPRPRVRAAGRCGTTRE